MKLRISALLATVVAVLVAAWAGAATATPDVAKPGFVPGTWIGKGTISGTSTDGPMTTRFTGGVTFKLEVSKKLRVSGTGKWVLNMEGSEDAGENSINSTMKGSASAKFAGSATSPIFSGTQRIVGEISAYGVTRSLKPFERPLTGRLAITRAGKCKVVGGSQVQPGVTLKWAALLKGSGTCNA